MTLTNRWPLARHFLLSEFEEPGTHLVMVHPVLVQALDELREKYGHPIRISSGYRGAQHNADVGGVPNSLHLIGAAADLIETFGTLDLLYECTKQLPQLLVIREVDHLHVEVAANWL